MSPRLQGLGSSFLCERGKPCLGNILQRGTGATQAATQAGCLQGTRVAGCRTVKLGLIQRWLLCPQAATGLSICFFSTDRERPHNRVLAYAAGVKKLKSCSLLWKADARSQTKAVTKHMVVSLQAVLQTSTNLRELTLAGPHGDEVGAPEIRRRNNRLIAFQRCDGNMCRRTLFNHFHGVQVFEALYTQLGLLPLASQLVALHIVDTGSTTAAMTPANLALITRNASALQELSFPCRPPRYVPCCRSHTPACDTVATEDVIQWLIMICDMQGRRRSCALV